MDDFQQLIQDSGPWLAPVLGTTILLLCLPLIERQARSILALVFVIAGLAIGLTGLSAEGDRVLDVVNPFPPAVEEAPPEEVANSEGSVYLENRLIERQTAPSSAWSATVGGLFLVMALGTWLTRGRDCRKGLWLHATAVGLFVVFARLCFEKVAAPAGLVWATGASFTMVPLGVFFGLYSRRRENGLWAMVGGALISGLLIRAGISAVSYLATIKGQGSHLDVHTITSFNSPILGKQEFDSPTASWIGCILIPQMAMWAPMHAISALLFGWIARLLTREKASNDNDAFEAALPPIQS
ncbi:MAG: hypothetical protein AAF196_03620 [Planctomycetota bacterium]